jgi:hypothetical protein
MKIAVIAAAVFALAACATQRQAEGTAVGAVGGALVGGPVGAVVGAGAGAVIAGPGGPAGGGGKTCYWTDIFGGRHSYKC